MRETWVRSLSWEDPLEKGKITHYSSPAYTINGYSLMHIEHCLAKVSTQQILGE